jgi:hypothetical protein
VELDGRSFRKFGMAVDLDGRRLRKFTSLVDLDGRRFEKPRASNPLKESLWVVFRLARLTLVSNWLKIPQL